MKLINKEIFLKKLMMFFAALGSTSALAYTRPCNLDYKFSTVCVGNIPGTHVVGAQGILVYYDEYVATQNPLSGTKCTWNQGALTMELNVFVNESFYGQASEFTAITDGRSYLLSAFGNRPVPADPQTVNFKHTTSGTMVQLDLSGIFSGEPTIHSIRQSLICTIKGTPDTPFP